MQMTALKPQNLAALRALRPLQSSRELPSTDANNAARMQYDPQDEISEVTQKILQVEASILDVQAEIKFAEANVASSTGEDRRYWMNKADKLMGKGKDLRAEKGKLMDIKAKLIEKADVKKGLMSIPGDIKFVRSIDECSFSDPEYTPRHYVGMDLVVTQCLSEIRGRYRNVTTDDGSYRKSPLGISRLGRGGKSTVLRKLFNALKKSDMKVNPVYISFNGNFKFQDGESQAQAILRMIASQLINTGGSTSVDLVCDEEYLEKYIRESERPLILLIDELNSLGNPLQTNAAILLRKMFLDPADRYLVFSTHAYLTVDSTINALG
jgi:hypothetical protein